MISLNNCMFLSCFTSILCAVLMFSSSSRVAAAQQQIQELKAPAAALGEAVLDDESNLWNNKRGWKDVSGSWGKRAWGDLQGTWGKRAWDKMNGAWGKRLSPDEAPDAEVAEEYWNSIEKRPEWNKLKGSWGKRAANNAGWSNLRGLWGKRSWNKLQHSWGKRSVTDLDDNSNAHEMN